MRAFIPSCVLIAGAALCTLCSCTTPADAQKRKVVLPQRLRIAAMHDGQGTPRLWSDIEQAFLAGDEQTRDWVQSTLRRAREWAQRPDAYYEALFRPESPFGSSTLCCPHHPEMSGWVPFNWDPEHPWRLTCPLCEKEGRVPAYYPNDLYPDSGEGCRPTDGVWRQTHDEAWGARYNIPWDHWDGHTHGHIDSFAFFFLGHCQWRIFFELNWRHQVLGTLCRGYLFASRLYPEGSAERAAAPLYAHKAKLIMVMMSRAIMGDGYLRDVLGMTQEQFEAAVSLLALDQEGRPLALRAFPGHEVKDNISDHSANDPEHPLGNLAASWWNNALTRFPGSAGQWADEWLKSYAMIRPAFTEAEREAQLDGMVQRLLCAAPEDSARLAALGQEVKPGVVEEGMDPYTVDLKGNLAGSAAFGALNVGLMLDDPEILRSAVTSVHRYLRSYFTTDGLGYETSPHYTQVALSNLAAPLALIDGLSEGFGPQDAFWDPATEALRPYRDEALLNATFSPLLSLLPDGLCAPWTDSWVTERPNLAFMAKVATAAGGVPDKYLPWLDVTENAEGELFLALKADAELPGYVLEDNGLAVMNFGSGRDRTLVSVDWSRRTGHSHEGPFNLLVYAAGHEMLFDQGYLNNVTPTQAWMGCAEAHNTALVRTANGSTTPCVNWRGSKRFFADTPGAAAVEVAEEDPEALHKGLPADQEVLYRRTVTVLGPAAAGRVPPYVVDIFRLQGGTTHDYYLHSLGDELTTGDLALRPAADPAESLHAHSGFAYKTSTGAGVIRDLRTGASDRGFTATWRHMTDWRTNPPGVDTEAAAFVHVLGAPGTQVLAGTGPGQRYIDARDVAQRVNLLCLRRSAEAYRRSPDAFVTAMSFSRDGKDPLRTCRKLRVASGEAGAVGVCIEREGGVDYVLSALSDEARTVFEDEVGRRRFTVSGALAVARYPDDGPREELLLRAQGLEASE